MWPLGVLKGDRINKVFYKKNVWPKKSGRRAGFHCNTEYRLFLLNKNAHLACLRSRRGVLGG